MLIHPWDAPLDAAQWRDFLGAATMFGQLVVNNIDLLEQRRPPIRLTGSEST